MARILASVASIPLTAFWSTAVLAQPAADRDFWWHPGWGYGHMLFDGLMMIAFWGGIILLIVLLVPLDGRERRRGRRQYTWAADAARNPSGTVRQG